MIDRRALYFAHLSTLGDPYEGVETRGYLDAARRHYGTAKPIGVFEHHAAMMEAIRVHMRNKTFVSCWHMNAGESAAMWSQYIKNGEGVAIRTTFARFRDSVAEAPVDVNGGCVEYLDYETELPTNRPESENIMGLVCSKRKSFEHEREFRGICCPGEDVLPQLGDSHGLYVPIDVGVLIQDVFVAPHAPAWQADLLRRVLAKYELSKDVHHSTLLQVPNYLPEAALEFRFDASESKLASTKKRRAGPAVRRHEE
jgi:hypothetical protein